MIRFLFAVLRIGGDVRAVWRGTFGRRLVRRAGYRGLRRFFRAMGA
jgi:hypothetical protein